MLIYLLLATDQLKTKVNTYYIILYQTFGSYLVIAQR